MNFWESIHYKLQSYSWFRKMDSQFTLIEWLVIFMLLGWVAKWFIGMLQ
jgi:hypothetical protein